MIWINIICSNGNMFPVSLDTAVSKVVEFKDLLAEISFIPANKQKLIYRGITLEDDQTLDTYGFQDDHTIYMEVAENPLFAETETAPPSDTTAGMPDMSQLIPAISMMMQSLLSNPQGTQMVQVLAITDNVVLPANEFSTAVRLLVKEAVNIDPLIVTQASSLSSLPVDASSTDFVVSISKSSDFPGDKFFEEFSRVLKPGGEIFIQQTSADAKERTKSSLEQKLLVAGFSDIQVVPMAELQSFGYYCQQIKAKKPTWKIGSSFSLKKSVKSLSKVLIDDDMDLIDEDNVVLLSEEDLKKPQLPPVEDCEVWSTRKACKNCSEEEEKVKKLGVTVDQLENPQPACGSAPESHLDLLRQNSIRHSIPSEDAAVRSSTSFK